jgi:hypothetical protein
LQGSKQESVKKQKQQHPPDKPKAQLKIDSRLKAQKKETLQRLM